MLSFRLLLILSQICEKLGLSYRNSQELNKIIDDSLPGRPKFVRREVVLGDEVFEMFSRDIIECTKALFGDPEFSDHLKLSPERHFSDEGKTNRLFHEMNTSEWWWYTQVSLYSFVNDLIVISLS